MRKAFPTAPPSPTRQPNWGFIMSNMRYADIWIHKSATGVLNLTLGTSQGKRFQWQGQWQEKFQVQGLGQWLKGVVQSLIPEAARVKPLVHLQDEASLAVPPLIARFATCERTFAYWLSARLTFEELEADLQLRVYLATNPVQHAARRVMPRPGCRQPLTMPALLATT